jgi:alpha-1,6-mannosyltransferase
MRPGAAAVAAIAVAATSTAAFVVARPTLSSAASIALVVLAFAAWATAVVTARALTDPRFVVGVIATLLLVAVLTPPRQSHDLWGYAEYGRLVSVHGVSPYDEVPSAFPHDPLLGHMGSGYRSTRSPYGPVFTGVSAVGTALTGPSTFPTRVFFQGIEALAVAVALALLWRRTRRVDALVWVGLSPLVVISVVNGGHNDGLVALGILGALLLATDRRHAAAGVVLGVAVLVKLPVALALGGLVLWIWRGRKDRRGAVRTAVSGSVVVATGYLIVGTNALDAIGDSGDVISRSSVWTPVHDLLADGGRTGTAAALPTIALGGVVALALLLAFAWSRDTAPEPSSAGASSAFAFAGGYVLPWYAAWGLPAFGVRRPPPLAWLVAAQGAVLLVAYQLPHHASSRANGLLVHRVVTDVAPVALLAAVLVLAIRALASSSPGSGRLRFARGRPGARPDRSSAAR